MRFDKVEPDPPRRSDRLPEGRLPNSKLRTLLGGGKALTKKVDT